MLTPALAEMNTTEKGRLELGRLLVNVEAYQDVVISERLEPKSKDALVEDMIASVPEWVDNVTDWDPWYLFYCVRFRFHLRDPDAIDYRETRKRKMGAFQRKMQQRRNERYGKR